MIFTDSLQFSGNAAQCLIPGDAFKLPRSLGSPPLQRVQDSIGGIDPLPQRSAPHAGPKLWFRTVVGLNPLDLSVGNVHLKQTGPPAMGCAYRGNDAAFGFFVKYHMSLIPLLYKPIPTSEVFHLMVTVRFFPAAMTTPFTDRGLPS